MSIFCSVLSMNVSNSWKLVQGRVFLYTTDTPLEVRKSAEVFVRQARPFDER